MASIRKSGSKWQVQTRRAGHSSITKTFNRREEAIAWGRSQEVRLDASEAGIALPIKEPLAKLLGRYVAEITPQKKSAALSLLCLALGRAGRFTLSAGFRSNDRPHSFIAILRQ